MEKIKKLFAEQKYEALKTEIYRDADFRRNAVKLRYLISAFYYSRDYQGTMAAIELLKPLEVKTAYSMFINTEITLGSNPDAALGYIDQYLGQKMTKTEKNWAYFQKGLCYLAKDQKTEAVRILEAATPLESDIMEAERHFFLNNSRDKYDTAVTDFEKINDLLIEARINRNVTLAKEARSKAITANYGEAEYFSTVILSKYMEIPEDKLLLVEKFGSVAGTIYYRII